MAETPGKKRKRIAERSDGVVDQSPSRGTPNLTPTIKLSAAVQSRHFPPIIATSPGVHLPDNVEFHSYSKPMPQTPKRRKSIGQEELLLHSSSHKTMDYTAREDGPNGMGSLLKHYICIFSPETGDLQVIESRKMVVRGGVRSLAESEEATPQKAHMQRRTELGEAFGTKKAKKALDAIRENAILSGANGTPGKLGAGDAALMNVIGKTTADMPTREEIQTEFDESRPIPKGNFDAEDIHGVYDPMLIVGADILNAIPVREWQEKVRKDESILASSRFVVHRVTREASRPDSAQRLRVLRYLLFLIVFWQLSRRTKSASVRNIGKRELLRQHMQPAPEAVIESIRRKFSDQGEMRKLHIDLLMTHCAALSCVVDGFETDIYDLREDLKLEEKDMALYFAEIGAQTKVRKVDGNKHRVATLALPLQLPKLRVGRGPRR